MTAVWKKLKESSERLGYRRVLHRTYFMPNSVEKVFTIKHERAAVCIFALTKNKEVIIAKQFRPGPEKGLLELPGGGVDEGETPEVCAQRELLEETGYAGKMEFIGTTLDCAYSTMIRYNYVAIDCEKIAAQELDDSEFIDVVLISLKEFLNLLRSGEMSDIETGYRALDHLGLLKANFSDF